jgi:hypothetical protein
MSCGCNNNLQQYAFGNNFQHPVQQQCHSCQYRSCECNECNNRKEDKKVGCGCDECKHKHRKEKKKEGCGCDDCKRKNRSDRSEEDCDNKPPRKARRCDKCRHRKCECIEYVPCYKTKCGFISAILTKTSSPTFFTAVGDVITYIYTITNTGNIPISDPIRICDDHLGGQIIPCSFILPGASQSFTRTYTIIASDLLVSGITNTAVAYIEVDPKRWVITPPSSATVTFGSADLFGTITQALVLGAATGTVEVTVTISNSALSSTAAQNVILTLPFPVGISGVISGVPAPTAISATSVLFSIPSLAVGASSTFRFRYIAGSTASGASYAFAGTIASSTFDPNPANNFVSSTFVFP